MKKVMLSAAVCAMAFSANADVADEVVIAEAIQASAFDSIYAGLGIGGSFLKGDDIPYASTGQRTEYDVTDWKGELGTKANRFIGSFVLGGGKTFNNKIYVGAEFLMDFTKNKKFDATTSKIGADDTDVWVVIDRDTTTGVPSSMASGKIEGKIGGFIPQINAKIGYAFNKCTLAYLKLGCAWTKVTVDVSEATDQGDLTKGYTLVDKESGSKTKGAFVLGLGAEKAFCKKFSAAVEGDYDFGWKYKGLKFNKGLTVRALVKYNVKY